MKKAKGYIGVPTNDCKRCKVLGHSCSHKFYTATTHTVHICGPPITGSSSGATGENEAKSKSSNNQSESRKLVLREASKVMQKISAFGPAHAEKARKLYQIKGIRAERGPEFLPNHSHIQPVGYIQKSYCQHAEVSTNEVNITKDPVHYGQRVPHRKSTEDQVSVSTATDENQPILKIVTITPRPNAERARKPKSSSDAGETVYSREGLVKNIALNNKDRVQQNYPCATILQILGEISGSIYTPVIPEYVIAKS